MAEIQKNYQRKVQLSEEYGHIAYIDNIRIFAAVMVIMLHCLSDYLTSIDTEASAWWIAGMVCEMNRVGVPLFFMISGYLVMQSDRTRQAGTFYRRRIKRLVLPFFVWNFLYYVYFRLVEQKPFFSMNFVLEFFNTGSGYHLWFVYSMLILSLFMPFVKMVLDASGRRMQWIFFLLTILQTTIKPTLNLLLDGKIYFYFAEDGMIGYLGYVVLGWLLGSSEISKSQSRAVYILGGITALAAAKINCTWAAEGRGFVLNGGYTINHYLEAAAVFLMFRNGFMRGFFRIKKKLSNACMTVYFVHVFFVECGMRYVYPRAGISLCWFSYALAAAVIVVSFGAALLWGEIYKKIECLGGRKNVKENKKSC